MSDEFLEARLAAVKLQIVAYETALTALAKPEVYSYTLDTGQSKQTVTRNEIGRLQDTLDVLIARYQQLAAICSGGGGTVNVTPGW